MPKPLGRKDKGKRAGEEGLCGGAGEGGEGAAPVPAEPEQSRRSRLLAAAGGGAAPDEAPMRQEPAEGEKRKPCPEKIRDRGTK